MGPSLPYDRLLPRPPVAAKNTRLGWLLEIINFHNKMPSICSQTPIMSPEMLDFFQGKGNIAVRNVIPKRIFAPERFHEVILAPLTRLFDRDSIS